MNCFVKFGMNPFEARQAVYCKSIEQLSLHPNQQEFEL